MCIWKHIMISSSLYNNFFLIPPLLPLFTIAPAEHSQFSNLTRKKPTIHTITN